MLAGCTQQQSSHDLKEQTAQATADVKRDAKAVAAGISEGWSRDKQLDLNTATKDQLLSLPGVTAAAADRVIAGRPYNEPGEVMTRRIMSKAACPILIVTASVQTNHAKVYEALSAGGCFSVW